MHPPSSSESYFGHVVPKAALLAAFFFAPGAGAFCQTTTCELSGDPLSCERDASQCSTEGAPVAWEKNCIGYAIQAAGSPAEDLDASDIQLHVEQAFARFADVECPGGGSPSFRPFFEGFVECDEAQAVCGGSPANVSTIIFHDENWPTSLSKRAAGFTSVVADIDTGEIIDADLEVNSEHFDFGDGEGELNLDLVLTHEIGHFLGLAHSDAEGAMMSEKYHELGGLELSEDDAAAICAAYPPIDASIACGGFEPAYNSCETTTLQTDAVCEDPVVGPTASGCSFAPGGSSIPSENLMALMVVGWILALRRALPLRRKKTNSF